MSTIGTPFTDSATRILLLGSGELGKEFTIECQRLGCEVIACDYYPHAPAMQVADHARVFSMLDAAALRAAIEDVQPDFIVPEVEAIATDVLVEMEQKGFCVVPSAEATRLTMNREGIRTLAAEVLNLPTSDYRFASDYSSFCHAATSVGYPCFVKPIMSSSGKGQSKVADPEQLREAWEYAQQGGRAGAGKVIVEAQVTFDYEITLLTTRTREGTVFCAPIGHVQQDGDYQHSWQPQPMSQSALGEAQRIAATITEALGGYGVFGVELFVSGDTVIFSEVSPRPHDTGMVTMISQNLSEFALHARAILGLPVPTITCDSPSASAVITAHGHSNNLQYHNLAAALSQPHTELRLFGKPAVSGSRRMGVALAKAMTIEEAIEKATRAAATVTVELTDSEPV